jgi:ABC-type transport system involved in cytochrome c biogenesis ATPase subunit
MNTPRNLRVTAFQAKSLFGSLDVDVALDESAPTILTGANGTGKSTLLRLVAAVAAADAGALAEAPLDYFSLHFEGHEPSFVMTRSLAGNAFDLEWGKHQGQIESAQGLESLPAWALDHLEATNFDFNLAVHGLARAARQAGVDYPGAEYLEVRQAIRRSSRQLEESRPDWLGELAQRLPVLFVSDQRLVKEPNIEDGESAARRQPFDYAVETASNALAKLIRDADSSYARASQMQDRSLPDTILRAMNERAPVSPLELMHLAEEVKERRTALRRVGLLDGDDASGSAMPDHALEHSGQRIVMNAVLEANYEKLNVLSMLEERLSAFKQFLDLRFHPKTVQLSRSQGLVVSLPNNQTIRPKQLSSGEQQILVLAYEIIFRSAESTLVIIDEPEISLHVLWQDTLVEDLAAMGAPNSLKFLLATHSPMILAEHSELERSLGEMS